MRVRFLTSIAAPDWSFAPGQEADVPDAQAVGFVQSGIAEPVKAAVQTASKPPARETATTRKPRR